MVKQSLLALAFMATPALAQNKVPQSCITDPAPLSVMVNTIQSTWDEVHLVGFFLGDQENNTAAEMGWTVHVYTNIDTGSFSVIMVFGTASDPLTCAIAGGYGPMFSYMEDAHGIPQGEEM